MIVSKKAIPRRTILRGLGAAIALPLLDSMVPAFATRRVSAATLIRRLGIVYVPNGMIMNQWRPAADGPLAISPTLQPLEAFRDRMLVISGLSQPAANPLPGEGAGPHARASAAYLTGVHAKKTEGPDLQAGVSLDQLAARELGRQTQISSLELALDAEFPGACDGGYSCAYVNTLSWRTPTTPMPMEIDPRAVFERLFGASDSTDRKTREARLAMDRSILDSVSADIAGLGRGLGPRDKSKLAEYLDAVRDAERRIQLAEQQSERELPAVGVPAGVPSDFEEHVRLMFDLQVLAYQCDLTRVSTFMLGREVSGRSFPQIGVADQHHGLSHHGNDPEKMAKVAKIDAYHTSLFRYYLEKLQATPDGDGSLLDHIMILYGSGISDGNKHAYNSLPLMLVGGGAGSIKGGRHISFSEETPVANLYMTMLDKLGVQVERLGDSTGKVSHLSTV